MHQYPWLARAKRQGRRKQWTCQLWPPLCAPHTTVQLTSSATFVISRWPPRIKVHSIVQSVVGHAASRSQPSRPDWKVWVIHQPPDRCSIPCLQSNPRQPLYSYLFLQRNLLIQCSCSSSSLPFSHNSCQQPNFHTLSTPVLVSSRRWHTSSSSSLWFMQ